MQRVHAYQFLDNEPKVAIFVIFVCRPRIYSYVSQVKPVIIYGEIKRLKGTMFPKKSQLYLLVWQLIRIHTL